MIVPKTNLFFYSYIYQHQGGSVPPGDEYAEMICGQCLPKHVFLAYYLGLAGELRNINVCSFISESCSGDSRICCF